MNTQTALLNICILPTNDVARQCIALSQSFDDETVRFKLGGELSPHATIYMARFANNSFGAVTEALRKTVRSLKSPLFSHCGYYQTPGQYVEVSYQKNQELMALHSTIIQAIKSYRYKPGEPEYESFWGLYDQEQQKYAKETGYDLAYNLYRPHITLTRYKDGKPPTELPTFPQINLSFTPSRIALYKADENGAIYEELAQFQIL